MNLEGKRIGFAMTGSFCTFDKAIIAMEQLVNAKADIMPIMSFNAAMLDTRFGKAADFIERITKLTGKSPITTIPAAEPIGPKSLLDILIILPCTGNTLAKYNLGITDTPVLMAAKSHTRNNKPLVISISTNDALGPNYKNIGSVQNMKGVYFVPYRQDDAEKKPKSIVADTSLIIPTLELALDGKQIQPVVIS